MPRILRLLVLVLLIANSLAAWAGNILDKSESKTANRPTISSSGCAATGLRFKPKRRLIPRENSSSTTCR